MNFDKKKFIMDKKEEQCPIEALLKQLSGKWKAQIFRLATQQPLRFNQLLKTLEGSNRQSLANSLNELEQAGLLEKQVISQKPLHIEYTLTDKGKSFIPILEQMEALV
jgi:DNA-binding HxlR family transcriptional regulator